MTGSEEVRSGILAALVRDSVVRVKGLAATLCCSEMTVRRHLARMEAEGLIERSRGGASIIRRVRLEFDLYERFITFQRAKEAIGKAAAGLVKEGERILLDTGTTTLAMARGLHGRTGISVITTSLAIVSELLHVPGIECILLGGTVRETSPDLYGPLVEENLARIHADRAFFGCDGLSLKGDLMTTDLRVARATTLMIENCGQAVLLTDSSKAGRNAFITFGSIEQVDCLITDDKLPGEFLDLMSRKGVETVLATVAGER